MTVESQLATARYQNQGLKALLSRTEGKHEEATKQLAAEKSVKLLNGHSTGILNAIKYVVVLFCRNERRR